MKQRSFSMVIGELGSDWAHVADLNRIRFDEVLSLLRCPNESALEFARRVADRLKQPPKLTNICLVFNDDSQREALAARWLLVQAGLGALAGTPDRELQVFCEPTTSGLLPGWLTALAQGIEERDPALNFSVDCHTPCRAA